MFTRTEDQIARVLALKPRGKAQEGTRPALKLLRGKGSEQTAGDVVELSDRRRPTTPHHFEPQGGDAA